MSGIHLRIVKPAHLGLLALFFASMSFAQTPTYREDAAERLAGQACASCHGKHGDSASPMVPRLAAQQVGYLKAEILDFRTHERNELLARNIMQKKVAGMDEATALSLARYYAMQPPVTGQAGDPDQIAKGRALYEQGNENQAACATCHGAHAEGLGIFPRLAGQHAVYLRYQLGIKQRDFRRTSVMHGLIGDLTSNDMADLAAYLASIP